MFKPRALCAALAVSLAFPLAAYADDGFEGWDESTEADAWSVYETTDWSEMQDKLVLGQAVSTCTATGITSRVEALRDEVTEVLEDSGIKTTHAKSYYAELMLAMIQVLSNGSPDADDPCNVLKYIDPGAGEMTEEKSIRILFRRITGIINTRNTKGWDTDILEVDRSLKAAIEGVILGTEYGTETKKYSVDGAKEWYAGHKDSYADFKVYESEEPSYTFCKRVLSYYRVCGSSASAWSGDMTDAQKAVVAEAESRNGYGLPSSRCQGWVRRVYEHCGYTGVAAATATAAKKQWGTKQIANDKTPPEGAATIPPGAAVYMVHQWGATKSNPGAGHVAIYVGNGMCLEHVGGKVQEKSLAYYMTGAGKIGYGGIECWGWPGGHDLTKP